MNHRRNAIGEGSSNAHTRGTLERLRRERRDLLNRMKEEIAKPIFVLFWFNQMKREFAEPIW